MNEDEENEFSLEDPWEQRIKISLLEWLIFNNLQQINLIQLGKINS